MRPANGYHGPDDEPTLPNVLADYWQERSKLVVLPRWARLRLWFAQLLERVAHWVQP